MNERLNVRRMQMPEGANERRPFDPERDITKKDWDQIAQAYTKRRGSPLNLVNLVMFEASVKLLSKTPPEVFSIPDLDRGLNLRSEIDDMAEKKNWRDFFDVAKDLKFVSPMSYRATKLSEWREARADLQHRCAQGDWHGAAILAQAMRLEGKNAIYAQDLLSAKQLEGMQVAAEEYRRDGNRWPEFMLLATTIKIFDPSKELKISDDDWNAMKSMLQMDRKRSEWMIFCRHARNMYILAGDIELTDIRLEIKPRGKQKDLHLDTPPMPATSHI